MAEIDWSKALSREEAEKRDYPDFEDGEAPDEVWPNRRSNETSGYSELHVVDLNQIKDGASRRMYAVYGVPVGWGVNDAELEEFQERFQEIEEARSDEVDFASKLDDYGFLDEAHYLWVRERIEGGDKAQAAELQKLLDAQTAQLKSELNARLTGELAGELVPVEGVTLEQWAWVQAKLASGQDLAGLLKTAGMDMPKWDRVSAEWNARMSRDQTASIATAYGQAFLATGAGPFGEAGKAAADALLDPSKKGVAGGDPISFERWIEIQEAQSAGVAQGKDAAAILASFGMTPADWGTVGGYWAQKFGANAMAMLDDYNRLTEKYRAKYASAGAADDVEY